MADALITNGWDYQSSLPPSVSEDFKKTYYQPIKGGTAIKVAGLMLLAHEKGVRSFTTDILQFPSADNNMTCIVKAIVEGYDWDPVEKKIVPVTYSRIGDANTVNCNGMVAPHFIRMAETRAVGRVLRAYLNVTFVTLEEISEILGQPMMEADQYNMIISLSQRLNLYDNNFAMELHAATGTYDIGVLTLSMADAFINHLNDLLQGGNQSASVQTPQTTPPPAAAVPTTATPPAAPAQQPVVQPAQQPVPPQTSTAGYNLGTPVNAVDKL